MALTVDEMLKEIGECRQFQWLLMTVIGYSGLAIAAFSIMVVSFITAEPDWKCVEGYKNNSVCNFTEPITLTSDNYKARCDMPREAWTYVEGFTSTVTEYDLVCSKSILLSIAQSCYYVGMLLGLLFGGYLADRFGRRKILYSGFVLVTVPTWIMIFPKEFLVFIVARVVIGLGSGFRSSTNFILLSEFTTEKYRALVGLGSFTFWVAGIAVIPLIAYLVREWRHILLVTAVFAVPCLFSWWVLIFCKIFRRLRFLTMINYIARKPSKYANVLPRLITADFARLIPESPRWLMLHRGEDKAREQLAKVAKMNKKPMPDDDLAKPEINGCKGSIKCLFLNWKVTKTTLICCDLWFAISLVYNGISYGSVDLGGNRYLNVFLTSIIELPSNFASIWSVNRFGRKKSIVTALAIAFLASALSLAIPTKRSSAANNGGRILVAVVAKFFINFAFGGIYVWTAELFPTFIRSTGQGVAASVSRLGSFSASYIIWLIRIHALLPYGLMGLICLQAAILGLLLPETKSQPTLETMDDMINQADRSLPFVIYKPESNKDENVTAQLCDEKA